MVSWLPLFVDAFHKTCYAGSQVWFVLANAQWYTRVSDRQSGVCTMSCSSCLPTPRLSALRAAAPLHNDGQRWLLADATQHSLYGACRRYTRLSAVWAVVADVHKTLCAVLAATTQQLADATQDSLGGLLTLCLRTLFTVC